MKRKSVIVAAEIKDSPIITAALILPNAIGFTGLIIAAYEVFCGNF